MGESPSRRDGEGNWTPAQQPDELRADIEQNLTTLGVDRLAAVNLRIHSGDPNAVGPVDRELFDRQLDAMIAARDEGLIDGVGLSSISVEHLQIALERTDIATVQNAYNLISRPYETALAEVSLREDVALLAYSALGQGFLTGKYQNGARPVGARTTLFDRGQRYQKPGTEAAIDAYLAIAAEHGLDPAQMALSFALSRGFMTSVILGATTMEQLKTDIAAQDVVLAPEVIEKIEAVDPTTGNPAP